MNNDTRPAMKQLVAAVQRGEGSDAKSYWTRIGVAFQNRDGSFNLRFDFVPTDPDTTIQLRDFDRREPSDEAPEEEPAPKRSRRAR